MMSDEWLVTISPVHHSSFCIHHSAFPARHLSLVTHHPTIVFLLQQHRNHQGRSRAMSAPRKLAILVGGGPAPGINAVISAAAIEAINEGFEVVGVQEGFKHLIGQDTSKTRPLKIEDVSRIHLDGGSVLGTARDNPTKSDKAIRSVVDTLTTL